MRKLLITMATMAAYSSLFGYITYQTVFVDKVSAVESSVTSQEISQNEQNTERGQGLRRAIIGLQEYAKHPRETTQNCNCGPEIDKYTQDHPGQWCTMFASWVAKEAGTPVYSDKTHGWRIRRSRDMMYYLQKHGSWTSAAEARRTHQKPQPGDYIILYRGQLDEDLGHTALVVKADGPAGTANVLSGNHDATIELETNFPYEAHPGFLGFGHPVNGK